MKRTFAITLGALTLVLAASVALADDQPATTSSTTSSTTTTTTTHHHHHSSSSKHSKVDINTASKDDLMKLPGMTDETADKIVAGRPYKSSNELVSKKILTEPEYKKMHGWVSAKQPKAETKAQEKAEGK